MGIIVIDDNKLDKLINETKEKLTNNITSIVMENYIPKADYENRLKADLKAILVELQLEIEELDTYDIERTHGLIEDGYVAKDVNKVIQEKINALKENKDGNN